MACSVAIANIDLFNRDNTFTKIAKIKQTYLEFMPQMQKCNNITNIRTIGTLLAWDIKNSDGHYKTANAEKIKNEFLTAGYNMRPLGNSFYLLPPYSIRMLSVHLFNILKFFM